MQTVPYSLESEQNVIGSIFLNSDSIVKVCDTLTAADFFVEKHRIVYQAMLDLYLKGEPIDWVVVTNELRKRGNTDINLVDLLESTPTAAHIKHHAEIVRKMSRCREGINLAGEMARRFHETPESIETTIGELSNKLLHIGDKGSHRNPEPDDIIKRMMAMTDKKGILPESVRMGYITGGFMAKELWVIGAFSSTGKTAFALQMTRDILSRGKGVCYFSLEMPQEQLMFRLSSNISGVSMEKRTFGELNEADTRAVNGAIDYLGRECKGRFWLYDDVYDVAEIGYIARKHKLQGEGKLDVVFVDFIQNISGSGEQYERLTNAIIFLQNLAKRLDCCIVVLSQISNAEARENMGDNDAYTFKGSGALRDAADKAWVLTRDRDAEKNLAVGTLHAHLKKNRQGKIDTVDFSFEFGTGRIEEK